MRITISGLILGLSVSFFLCFPIEANDASLGRMGETVYPLQSTDVRMVSEDIYIKYNSSSASGDVSCEFVFKNEGGADTVLMGFPATLNIDFEALTTVENVSLHNFTAAIGDRYIEVRRVKGSSLEGDFTAYPSWYVFEVPFEQGETLTMNHTYDVNFTAYSEGSVSVGYVLETGATWNGEIEHSRVTFDMTEVEPWGIKMYDYASIADFTYSEGKLIFEKRNFKPDFNLEVMTNFAYNKTYSGPMPEHDNVNERIGFFNSAEDKTWEQLVRAYNDLSYKDKFIETVYMNSRPDNPEDETCCLPEVDLVEVELPRSVGAYVRDMGFDIKELPEIVIRDSSGRVLYRNSMNTSSGFGEFGTVIYNAYIWENGEFVLNNAATYEIIVRDESGNCTSTTFENGKLEEGDMVVLECEGFPNPPTHATGDFLLPALLILAFSSMLLLTVNNLGKRNTIE